LAIKHFTIKRRVRAILFPPNNAHSYGALQLHERTMEYFFGDAFMPGLNQIREFDGSG
jgi:hypothetical protein